MLASDFELLLQQALPTDQPPLFDKPVSAVFAAFDQAETRFRKNGAATPELHFAFERLRLGIAVALMQIFTDLGGDEASRTVLSVLKKAARATSTAQIDNIIQKESKAFDKLFQNLYTNTEGELILDLFARTLEADSRAEMTQIVKEALKIYPTLEFPEEGGEE